MTGCRQWGNADENSTAFSSPASRVSVWRSAWAGIAPDAKARGALGYDQDQCVLKIGPDFFYFSGYQFGLRASQILRGRSRGWRDHLCLRSTAQDELRQMKTDFRILRDAGESTDGAPVMGRRSLPCRPRCIQREPSASCIVSTIREITLDVYGRWDRRRTLGCSISIFRWRPAGAQDPFRFAGAGLRDLPCAVSRRPLG